jgi:hypothetical protein
MHHFFVGTVCLETFNSTIEAKQTIEPGSVPKSFRTSRRYKKAGLLHCHLLTAKNVLRLLLDYSVTV